jgi:exonuclease III
LKKKLELKVYFRISTFLGGDFNSVSNVMIIFDIWRSKYPDKNDFTWCNKDMYRQSRIDFWLISNSLYDSVVEVSIEPSILTDHKVIW